MLLAISMFLMTYQMPYVADLDHHVAQLALGSLAGVAHISSIFKAGTTWDPGYIVLTVLLLLLPLLAFVGEKAFAKLRAKKRVKKMQETDGKNLARSSRSVKRVIELKLEDLWSQVLPALQISKAVADELFERVDRSGDGLVSRPELIDALRNDTKLLHRLNLPTRPGDTQWEDFESAFQSMRPNINVDELATFLASHTAASNSLRAELPEDPQAALRIELEQVTQLSALKKRAFATGVGNVEIEHAEDGDSPRKSLIELIVAAAPVIAHKSPALNRQTTAGGAQTGESEYLSREQPDIEQPGLLQNRRARTRVRTPPSARARTRGQPVLTQMRGGGSVRARGEPGQARVRGASPIRAGTPVRARPQAADAAVPVTNQIAPATHVQQRTKEASVSPAMKTVKEAIKAATEAGQYEKLVTLGLLLAELQTTENAEAAAADQAAVVAEAVAEAVAASEAMVAAERAAAAEAMVAAEAVAAEAVAERLAAEDVVAQVKAAAAAAKVKAQQKAMATFRQVQVAALQTKIKTATEAGEYDQLPGLVAEMKALQVTTPSSRRPKSPPRGNPRLSKVPPALSQTPKGHKNARRP